MLDTMFVKLLSLAMQNKLELSVCLSVLLNKSVYLPEPQ